MIAPTNRNRVETFNRRDPNPPPYLSNLRAVGGKRSFSSHPSMKIYKWFRGAIFSTAIRQAESYLPNDRECFLDAGCGNSPDADLMGEYAFSRLLKVDLFPTTHYCHEYEHGVATFIQGDICTLASLVPAESVDMIGCQAVLDLMVYTDRALFYKEAFAVLRPGGIVSIYYQFLVHGYNDWDELREKKAMERAGFEVIKVTRCQLIGKKVTR